MEIKFARVNKYCSLHFKQLRLSAKKSNPLHQLALIFQVLKTMFKILLKRWPKRLNRLQQK